MAERTEGSIEIEATPAEVMGVITDYDSYPEWAQGVKKAEIRKRDEEGRPIEVFMDAGGMGIVAQYTLTYTYSLNDGGLSWTSTEASGAVKSIEGEYVLEATGGGTAVTYRTSMELAIPVIGLIKRQAQKMIINTALGGLKKRVESR